MVVYFGKKSSVQNVLIQKQYALISVQDDLISIQEENDVLQTEIIRLLSN